MAKGQYPTWKGKLAQWALQDGPPAGLSLQLALCNSDFVFDDEHESLDEIAGVVYEDVAIPSLSVSDLGRFSAPDVDIGGLEPNDTFSAIVIYWKWTGGTQLWLYTTESADQPLPIELLADSMRVKFSPSGLYQL